MLSLISQSRRGRRMWNLIMMIAGFGGIAALLIIRKRLYG
jgi:hypothetical protein